MKAETYQINHPSELNGLTTARPFRKRGRGRIRLSPEFEHQDRETWEAAINRYYHACGCSTGAQGLLLMLLLGLVAGVATYSFDVATRGQAMAIPIVAAIAGAVAGKLLGLADARRRLIKVVHTVQAAWKPRDRQETPPISCG